MSDNNKFHNLQLLSGKSSSTLPDRHSALMEDARKEHIRRQRQAERLERENNTLDNHWGAIKNVHINQQLSDYHYKKHVSRLMHTYTRPSGGVDNHLQPVSRVVKPVTQLYGVNGLRTSKFNDLSYLQQKEAGWEGRVDINEKIDNLNRKKFALNESNFEKDGRAFKSNANTHPSVTNKRSHSPIAATNAGHRQHQHQHQQTNEKLGGNEAAKKPSRRADFDGISENDLIANGLYTLAPQQLNIFNNFTDMISSFDNTDMIHILEDALEEARRKTGLEDYGGFAEKCSR